MSAILVVAALVAASVGFLSGLVVGALLGERRTIRARSDEKAMRLMPTLFPDEESVREARR